MGALGDFLIGLMRAVGYGICHQIPSRSLHYGVRVLPVCARDTGLFIGFTLCFIVLLIAYRRKAPSYPSWPKTAVLVALLLPTFIDAVTSYAGWRASSNPVRLVTGALAGTAVAAILFPLAAGSIARLRKQAVADVEPPMLEPWWSLPALILLPAALSLAMWPSAAWIFWIWAPLVTLSILFTLFALNFTLVSLLIDWWRGLERSHAAAWCVALGLGLVVIELIASNRLHWLTDKLL